MTDDKKICTNCSANPVSVRSKHERLCSSCMHSLSRIECQYCRTDFFQKTNFQPVEGTIACDTCAAHLRLGRVPTKCDYCGVDAAFVGPYCSYCTRYQKLFGDPLSCEFCGVRAAFRKPKAKLAKVGNKLLCLLCTRQEKRKLRDETKKSLAEAVASSVARLEAKKKRDEDRSRKPSSSSSSSARRHSRQSKSETRTTIITPLDEEENINNKERDVEMREADRRRERDDFIDDDDALRAKRGRGGEGMGKSSAMYEPSYVDARKSWGGERDRDRDRERDRDRDRDRERGGAAASGGGAPAAGGGGGGGDRVRGTTVYNDSKTMNNINYVNVNYSHHADHSACHARVEKIEAEARAKESSLQQQILRLENANNELARAVETERRKGIQKEVEVAAITHRMEEMEKTHKSKMDILKAELEETKITMNKALRIIANMHEGESSNSNNSNSTTATSTAVKKEVKKTSPPAAAPTTSSSSSLSKEDSKSKSATSLAGASSPFSSSTESLLKGQVASSPSAAAAAAATTGGVGETKRLRIEDPPRARESDRDASNKKKRHVSWEEGVDEKSTAAEGGEGEQKKEDNDKIENQDEIQQQQQQKEDSDDHGAALLQQSDEGEKNEGRKYGKAALRREIKKRAEERERRGESLAPTAAIPIDGDDDDQSDAQITGDE